MKRFTARGAVAALALTLTACAGGLTPTVSVDRGVGDWAEIQARADAGCIRQGYARGQFLHWRDSEFAPAGFGIRGRRVGDQRFAEFICRSN